MYKGIVYGVIVLILLVGSSYAYQPTNEDEGLLHNVYSKVDATLAASPTSIEKLYDALQRLQNKSGLPERIAYLLTQITDYVEKVLVETDLEEEYIELKIERIIDTTKGSKTSIDIYVKNEGTKNFIYSYESFDKKAFMIRCSGEYHEFTQDFEIKAGETQKFSIENVNKTMYMAIRKYPVAAIDCMVDPKNIVKEIQEYNNSGKLYGHTLGGVCGDSREDEDEECDDGNTSSNDGCSSICTRESGISNMEGETTYNSI